MSATIRAATPEDAPELVRLAGILYESMGLEVDATAWRDSAIAAARRSIEEGRAAFFVAKQGKHGRIVACGGVSLWQRMPGPSNPSGRAAYVQWMVTQPEYRRRGLARRIFKELMSWVREQGVSAIDLHATPEGEPLYRSFGFVDPAFPELRRMDAPSGEHPGAQPV
jgi:GNAT superfamily N-acetyltransferase